MILKNINLPCLILGLVSGLFFVHLCAFADTEAGRLAVVNGDVRVGPENAPGRIAKPNDVVTNLDVVKTAANGSAKILFTDQSVMDVGPNSALKVSNYAVKDGENRTGTFSLLYGKMRALVTQKVGADGKVEVRSGDAVMGVRGTEFVVDRGAANSSNTSVVVVSGLVQFSPPGGGAPIAVGAGQMLVAPTAPATSSTSSGSVQAKSEAKSDSKSDTKSNATADTKADVKAEGKSDGPVLTKASAEQMQAATNTAKTEDRTFTAAVTIAPAGGSAGGPSSSALANVGAMVSGGNMKLPPPVSDSGTSRPNAPPEFLTGNMNFLPPVNIIPGNLVHLTVTVQ